MNYQLGMLKATPPPEKSRKIKLPSQNTKPKEKRLMTTRNLRDYLKEITYILTTHFFIGTMEVRNLTMEGRK